MPNATGQSSDSVIGSNTPSCVARIFARSWLSRIGLRSASWWHCSGVSSNVLPSGPIELSSDITSASRIGSIGGFVTCANSWWKYADRFGARCESTASGVSVPIEPSGSLPASAIGVMIRSMSSSV